MGVVFFPGVFVDANVWFSRTCRDWFGILYTQPEFSPFRVYWSEDCMAELIYHLRKSHPDWPGQRITTIRDRLCGTFEAGRVDDFTIEDAYAGPDAHDAHIHAATLASGSDYLVTFNVDDFEWAQDSAPFEVINPDDFLVEVDDHHGRLVAEATMVMTGYWLTRRGEADLPGQLRKAGCPQFAERVRRYLQDSM